MTTSTFSNAIATFGLINTSNSVYATAHGGNSPSVSNLNTGSGNGIGRNSFDTVNYTFYRTFFHFNMAAPASGPVIPTNAVIKSAFLRIPGENSSNNNVDSNTIGIYQSTVSTNTTIAAGDWLNFGATLLGSLAMASYNNAANNDIALNAAGLALINMIGGYTKIMAMAVQDHDAVIPTGLNNQTFSTTGLLLSVVWDVAGGDYALFV